MSQPHSTPVSKTDPGKPPCFIIGMVLFGICLCCGGFASDVQRDSVMHALYDSDGISPTSHWTGTPSRSPSASPSGKPTPTTDRTGPGAAPSDSLDPRFDTCAEARENGYGPYYEDIDPEYGWYQDRDQDGKVCEPPPGPGGGGVPDVDPGGGGDGGDGGENWFCRRKWWC